MKAQAPNGAHGSISAGNVVSVGSVLKATHSEERRCLLCVHQVCCPRQRTQYLRRGRKKVFALAHSLSGGFGKGLARRPYVRLCVPRPAARVRPVNIVHRGRRVTTRVQIVTAPVCAAHGGPEEYPCAHAPALWLEVSVKVLLGHSDAHPCSSPASAPPE